MNHGIASKDWQPREKEADRLRDLLTTLGPRFAEIVRQYRASLPGRIAAMEEGALMGAHDMLAVSAHRMAGSSASLGASEVALLCRALETACASQEQVPADWQQRLTAITRACDAFNKRLEALQLV